MKHENNKIETGSVSLVRKSKEINVSDVSHGYDASEDNSFMVSELQKNRSELTIKPIPIEGVPVKKH